MSPGRLSFLSIAIVLFFAARAWADCPAGCANVGPGVQQCSSAPTLDVVVNNPDYDCRGSAGYSFPAGTFYSKIIQLNGLHSSAGVSFDEDFTVTGLPGISTVWAGPLLYVSGQGGHDPTVAMTTTASLHVGSNTSTWVIHWPETYVMRDTVLSLPTVISLPAGGTFRATYSLITTADRPNGSGAMGEADVQATIAFLTDDFLPEHVASCRGLSEGPVAVLRPTWGRVKATYR